MQQYFADKVLQLHELYLFNQEDSKHIQQVMRMKMDSVVRIVDRHQQCFYASIQYQEHKVYGYIKEKVEVDSELPIKVTIYQGLIKKEAWDYFLQKATELGVSSIVPLISKRCVVKVNDKKDQKIQRFQKICQQASEQSKRILIPTVCEYMHIKEIPFEPAKVNIIAYEDHLKVSKSLKDVVCKDKDINLVIGPEGGFELQEVNELIAKGYQVVTLGKRILRAETASLYALSVISSLVETYE